MNADHTSPANIYEDYSVNHLVSTSLHMPTFHFHDQYEIYFSLTSDINCFINDRVYSVHKGDLFLFNSTDFHRFVVPDNMRYERFYILFSREYILPLCTEKTNLLRCYENRDTHFCHRIHLEGEQLSKFMRLLQDSLKNSNSVSYGADLEKKINLAKMLMMINSYFEKKDSGYDPSCGKLRLERSAVEKSKSEDKYSKVWPILDYIDNNLQETLTLDILSGNFYLSKYYMEVMFKNAIGLSVNEYIVNKRILKAKELLKQNLPVSQVAESVGFNSDSHFIRTFKKLVGLPPKQYSKAVR